MTVKKFANINNIDSANPLCLIIDGMIGHFRKEKKIKHLLLDDVDENKEVKKNITKFGKVLKKKLKRLMVAEKLNMRKIFKKLALDLMMICHRINL